MTLLHVVTTLPADLSEHDRRRAENAIRQCEVSLSVWGEGFRGAKRHEKLFKELVTAWEARKNDESKVNAPKALPPITSGCSQQPKPLQPPGPRHPTPQSEPRADVMSQFLHLVNFSQSTPTRPEQLGGQECLASAKKVMGFNGAEAAGGANTGLNSLFGTMAGPSSATNSRSAGNIPSEHPGPEGWRQSVAAVGDVHTGQWTTDVYLDNDVGSSHAAGAGLGIKDDFFS